MLGNLLLLLDKIRDNGSTTLEYVCHLVPLQITIEGVVHEKLFEADPNIQYTYAWDRLNEYRQVSVSGAFSQICAMQDVPMRIENRFRLNCSM